AEDEAYGWPFIKMPGMGALPWINDRGAAEAYLAENAPDVHNFRAKLYARERYAKYRRGTVLFYRHDTWHRGTPVKANALRCVQNLTFRRADADWIPSWNMGTARAMYKENMVVEKMVASASVTQRNVLGFPAPGHRYWTAATLAATAARYEPLGMDMAPYEKAAAERDAG
ncbi:unnamed protein product, partial [Phaeothamnion confervicola]